MVSLKEGVSLAGLQPQVIVALMAANAVWEEDGDDLVVTSCNDSNHSHTSLHYAGAAVDLRTRDVVDPRDKAIRLRRHLTKDFDVLFEGDHIHIEYQPRRR